MKLIALLVLFATCVLADPPIPKPGHPSPPVIMKGA